jgi:hypothetical protein
MGTFDDWIYGRHSLYDRASLYCIHLADVEMWAGEHAMPAVHYYLLAVVDAAERGTSLVPGAADSQAERERYHRTEFMDDPGTCRLPAPAAAPGSCGDGGASDGVGSDAMRERERARATMPTDETMSCSSPSEVLLLLTHLRMMVAYPELSDVFRADYVTGSGGGGGGQTDSDEAYFDLYTQFAAASLATYTMNTPPDDTVHAANASVLGILQWAFSGRRDDDIHAVVKMVVQTFTPPQEDPVATLRANGHTHA